GNLCLAALGVFVGCPEVRRTLDYGPRNGQRGTPAARDGLLECTGLRKQRHPGTCHRRPHRMKLRINQLTIGSMAYPPVVYPDGYS
ncbi:MAG: hypothetical protein PVG70_15800, partial [Desulfobacterales bacterium]